MEESWGCMDHNILTQIFEKVSRKDLFCNVSRACRSWKFACWDVLFWKSNILDLEYNGTEFTQALAPPPFPIQYSNMEILAMKLIISIFQGNYRSHPPQGWSPSLRYLLLPYDFHISDRILLYIAQRTPELTFVSLNGSDRITGRGFARAITHWKHLKFLVLGPIDGGCHIDIIRDLGIHCSMLAILHIHVNNFMLNKDSSTAIAMFLPGLQTLAFLGCRVSVLGIKTLAKLCGELSDVLIECCDLVEEEDVSFLCLRSQKPTSEDFEQLSNQKLRVTVFNNFKH